MSYVFQTYTRLMYSFFLIRWLVCELTAGSVLARVKNQPPFNFLPLPVSLVERVATSLATHLTALGTWQGGQFRLVLYRISALSFVY
jgi:hypothetical protein